MENCILLMTEYTYGISQSAVCKVEVIQNTKAANLKESTCIRQKIPNPGVHWKEELTIDFVKTYPFRARCCGSFCPFLYFFCEHLLHSSIHEVLSN